MWTLSAHVGPPPMWADASVAGLTHLPFQLGGNQSFPSRKFGWQQHPGDDGETTKRMETIL